MFQLEHELREWTKRFGRMEVMRGADMEELEQHVRDSIAELTRKGLSEEEAFLKVLCWLALAMLVHRWFVRQNEWPLVVRGITSSPRIMIGIGALIVLISVMAIRMGSQIAMMRIVPLDEFGKASRFIYIPNAIFSLLIPSIVVCIMLTIRRRMRCATG